MLDLDAPLPELFHHLVEGEPAVAALLELAAAEDGPDVTSQSVVSPASAVRGAIRTRESGVVAGLPLVPRLLEVAGAAGCRFQAVTDDGDRVEPGAELGSIAGPQPELLGAERLVLNVLARLGGVASFTRRFVDAVAGSGTRICDTRKTLPGWRRLDKYAVRCGGGTLHRLGLSDGVMYKDNHLAGVETERLAAFLAGAIARARAAASGDLRYVAVEVDDLAQLDRVLSLDGRPVDLVLLDNFGLADLREAVRRRDAASSTVLLEASGGVTLATVRPIAETGVDRISVGALTHSAPALDVGLDLSP